MAEQWHAKGTWFDVCKCNVPCPCSWAEAPTTGECEGTLVWTIDEGTYGDVKLDGLNVVGVATFTGNVWAGEHKDPKMGVFVDERADEQQREALLAIFGGQAGGWPQEFADTFGAEMVGMDFAPIEVEVADDLSSWRAEVPGRVKAEAKPLDGPTSNGQAPQVHNLPGSEVGPGQVATWGRSVTDTADAFNFNWDNSGQSSKLIPFDWTGPDG